MDIFILVYINRQSYFIVFELESLSTSTDTRISLCLSSNRYQHQQTLVFHCVWARIVININRHSYFIVF